MKMKLKALAADQRHLLRSIGTAFVTAAVLYAASALGAETLGNAKHCLQLEWDNDCTHVGRCLVWKNTCTNRVEFVVEITRGEESIATLVEEVAPRGVGSTNNTKSGDYGRYSADDLGSGNYHWHFPEGRLSASVFAACRMFRKGAEYHGIDPDDYSRCLKPEDVEDAPAKPGGSGE